MDFKISADFKPKGDQPEAIDKLVKGLDNGDEYQVLMGVTGSGKTFTMANIIERVQRPVLVLAHNKTLVGQLYNELKVFFPDNAVEYFVSYYDYYQPEAYMPSSDTYIEKDASINDEIDKMRHSATHSLMERRDVIVVASVSCIYGLGDPAVYKNMMLNLRPGMIIERDTVLKKLIEIQYERNDISFVRGTFRVKGDVVEVFPASSSDKALRLEFFGDEIERISEFNPLTGKVYGRRNYIGLLPATHYVAPPETLEKVFKEIENDMHIQYKQFQSEGKLIEAQRIAERVNYDIEMIREMGYCNGIENYSRYLDGRKPGEPSFSLIDYFPDDFIFFVDESHVTLSQVRAMYAGDRSRKENLVSYGFRLPAAFDNRPLKFEEFNEKIKQTICMSATPADYEIGLATQVVEQIIRPTGLLDPILEIRPVTGQVDHLYTAMRERIEKGERVLVTTLTKRMSEALTDYYKELGIKVRYLHSDIKTMERMEILRDLRIGKFDVLIGINLLREGLDLPEVSLVAILDADKEGFLRSETSMIQTIGRAARHIDGKVILYADKITGSMERAINETDRRRDIQHEYNVKMGITPTSIQKAIRDSLQTTFVAEEGEDESLDERQLFQSLSLLENDMRKAATALDFELAAGLRDQLFEMRKKYSVNN